MRSNSSRRGPASAGLSRILAAALLAAACSDAVGPGRGAPGAPAFSHTASGVIEKDRALGTLAAPGTPVTIIAKGFNSINPHNGSAVLATFFWISADPTNIIDSVADRLANGKRVEGNPYRPVEFIHTDGISMATYLATNIQNFPDAFDERTTPGDSIYVVEAFLRSPVTEGGTMISAFTGVHPVMDSAQGAHRSALGAGSSATVASPGFVKFGAGALIYAVSMANAAKAVFPRPGEDGDTSFKPLFPPDGYLSSASLAAHAAYAVRAAADSVNPRWTWLFDAPSDWLATAVVLNPATGAAPPPATNLAFTTQPQTTQAGQTMATVRVAARDASGNVVTSFTGLITVAIGANPGGGTLSGTTSVNAVSGVATFSTLSINNPGTGYTFTASATGLTGAPSTTFDITAAPPSGTILSATFDAGTDGFGYLDDPFRGTAAPAYASGAHSPTGGFAGGGLQVLLGGIDANLVPGMSGGWRAGFTLGAPGDVTITLRYQLILSAAYESDEFSEALLSVDGVLHGLGGTDRLALLTGGVGTVQTTGWQLVELVVPGLAAGAHTVTIGAFNNKKTGVDETTEILIDDVVVTTGGAPPPPPPPPATNLAFTTQPQTTQAGQTMATVRVAARDASGNVVTGFTGPITVAIGANPGGGTLSGTTSVNAVGGVATFSTLAIDQPGTGYTLTATSSGLTGTTSTAFTITPRPATNLVFTTQPQTTEAGQTMASVRVAARDDAGNIVTGFTGPITVAIGANPGGGTLSGTTSVNAVSGVATFSTLSISNAGNGYTLTASASGLTGATSVAFNITAPPPPPATNLAFTTQPQTAVAGQTMATVRVAARDASGNVVTTYNGTITVALGANPGGGTLSGTKSVAAVNGVASFSTLSINNVGSGYTLVATASGLTSATSAAFNITAPPNSAPVVNAGPDQTVILGLLYNLNVSFSDPDNGPWSYTIEWGDGQTSTGSRSAPGSFSVGHTYLGLSILGTRTIRVTITDSRGASGSDTKNVTIVLSL